MINIVHGFFRDALRTRHTVSPIYATLIFLLALSAMTASASDSHAAFGYASRLPEAPGALLLARSLDHCGRDDCPGRRPPGAPDRDARPFEGTLGRPCAYRRRFSPQGTRRVRVCF